MGADIVEAEQQAKPARGPARAWLKAARPHQWAKNALVLAPVALGWAQVSRGELAHAGLAMLLLCLLSSLTYVVNDIADVQADRRHATKQRRPFACGDLPLWQGKAVATVGVPVVLALGWLISPNVSAVLAGYGVLTLAYSFRLKRVAILDAFVIGGLFTLRLVLGVEAARLIWSPWLLTFALSFFYSLAMAKRHTELVNGGSKLTGQVPGRGYRYEDRSMTLVFGVAASMVAILIVVLYLMEEVFPLGAYHRPQWLWAAPPLIFLWVSRIWLLSNRGQMHDDPVVFALRDRASWGLGALMAAAFALAVL